MGDAADRRPINRKRIRFLATTPPTIDGSDISPINIVDEMK
jgi:hypothetical protein